MGNAPSEGASAGDVLRPRTLVSWMQCDGKGDESSAFSALSDRGSGGGFERKALEELRLLKTLWSETISGVPPSSGGGGGGGGGGGSGGGENGNTSLWFPKILDASSWLTPEFSGSKSSGILLPSLEHSRVPVSFLGRPVQRRLKTIIDARDVQSIDPILFTHGLISALRHCHARRIILGKSALSTSSIYMDADQNPVIVDLSGATIIRHSEIAKQLEIEIASKRNNEGRDAVAASKRADVRMKARDLFYMPIEMMLGSTVTTMPTDVWRAGMLSIHVAIGKPIVSGSGRQEFIKNIFKFLGGVLFFFFFLLFF